MVIVKGTEAEIAQNRGGTLAATQQQLLRSLPILRLPAMPGLLLGGLLMAVALVNQGGWLRIVAFVLGALMLLTGLSRLRQQRAIDAGAVRSLSGRITQIEPAPLRFIEAVVRLEGQQIIVPAGLPGEPLRQGAGYVLYVIDGVGRRPMLVAAEREDEHF